MMPRPTVATWVGVLTLLALVVFMLVMLQFGPDPAQQHVPLRLASPGSSHIFGTDQLGRDFASRVAWAMRGSATVAITVTILSGVGGGIVGILAGLSGGMFDTFVQRGVDAVMSVPLVLLALAAVAALGNSGWVLIVALSVAFLPLPLRVTRAAARSIRRADFVDAARVSGAGPLRVAVRHIGSNVVGPWATIVAAQAGGALLTESALSFVGAGGGRSLGALLSSEAQSFMQVAPWLAVFPGAAIFLIAFSVNLLSNGFARGSALR